MFAFRNKNADDFGEKKSMFLKYNLGAYFLTNFEDEGLQLY